MLQLLIQMFIYTFQIGLNLIDFNFFNFDCEIEMRLYNFHG